MQVKAFTGEGLELLPAARRCPPLTMSVAGCGAQSPRTTERRPGPWARRPVQVCRRSRAVSRRARAAAVSAARRLWQCRRSAEPDALRALHRQRLLRALRDQPALELREGGEHVRHRLPARRRGVHGAVERDERPVLLLRRRHQRGEVDHRAREPVELRHHKRGGLPFFEHPQRLLHAGPLHVLRREAGVLDHLDSCQPRRSHSAMIGSRCASRCTHLLRLAGPVPPIEDRGDGAPPLWEVGDG